MKIAADKGDNLMESWSSKFEYYQYLLAEKIADWVYPKYKFSEFAEIWRDEKEFLDYYKKYVSASNFHSIDRKYSLNQIIRLTLDVPGDTVECGVWEGASSYLICKNIFGRKKSHHVFDSFEGLSRPAPRDGSYWKEGDLSTSEEKCRANLKEFSFVNYYKGWIPERFKEVEHLRFSFVHIDVDLYDPTFESLRFFYRSCNPGAVILCDDYGFATCPGAKKAMDDFFRDKPEKVIMLTTGQAFIIKR